MLDVRRKAVDADVQTAVPVSNSFNCSATHCHCAIGQQSQPILGLVAISSRLQTRAVPLQSIVIRGSGPITWPIDCLGFVVVFALPQWGAGRYASLPAHRTVPRAGVLWIPPSGQLWIIRARALRLIVIVKSPLAKSTRNGRCVLVVSPRDGHKTWSGRWIKSIKPTPSQISRISSQMRHTVPHQWKSKNAGAERSDA